MIDGLFRAAGTSAALMASSFAALELSPEEHAGNISTIVLVAGGVGAVIAGLSWLDRRIEGKIRKHAEEEQRLDDLRQRELLAHVSQLLAENRRVP
jgi:hypothetical protein